MQKHKNGKLYLIPAPLAEQGIGHLPVALLQRVIMECDSFLVENIRSARRYISSLNLGISIENLQFEVLDKNSSWEDVVRLCAGLHAGHTMGVMSEAGCPGIADPGALAVQYAHEHHVPVVPIAGPSSVFMALMASGFNGQSFVFHGYLPIDKQKRQARIKAIERNSYEQSQTQIFIETPYRNDQLFGGIVGICKASTKLCVASGISGPQQMIVTKSIQEWRKQAPKLHKVPTVFLLSGG
jgi:16S rRNA (cytidine1402-2'-O)-methyltransferase